MKPLPSLTDWFPADVKPARPGVYEVEPVGGRLFHRGSTFLARWDGSLWSVSGWELPPARWRGLSADPATYTVPDDVDGPLPPERPVLRIDLPPGAVGAHIYRGPSPDFDRPTLALFTTIPPDVALPPAHHPSPLPSGWPVIVGALLCLAAFAGALLSWT